MGVNKEIEELDEVEETKEKEEQDVKKVKEEKCEECKDCKECKTKKGSRGLVTTLIASLIVVSAICGWIVGTSSLANTLEEKRNEVSQETQKELEDTEDDTTEVEEKAVEKNDEVVKVEETTTPTNSNSNAPRCTGTYYGKYYNKDSNGITVNLEYTYVLKEDGTFTANISNIHKYEDRFIISGNTATFIETKDTYGGPNEEDNMEYKSVDYYISDDCSHITIDSKIGFKLDRQ